MINVHTAYYTSPIGTIEVQGTQKGILSLLFLENEEAGTSPDTCLQDCIQRLDSYFSGSKEAFTGLQLVLHSTDFQQKVLDALWEIPYGTTATYGEIAQKIQHDKAVRAVGTAVGRNPLCIIFPCHRVLPASGKLGKYAWGSWRKQWLMEHEEKWCG